MQLTELPAFFFKPDERYVKLNGGLPARFVSGTATDGLPLRAASGTDYPPPFNVAVGATKIAVTRGMSPKQGGGQLTYKFLQ